MRSGEGKRGAHGDGLPDVAEGCIVLIELVGTAGVGKSHLQGRLLELLGSQAADPYSFGWSVNDLRSVVGAVVRFAPMFAFMLRSSRETKKTRQILKYSMRLLRYAFQEERARRARVPPRVVVSANGWYHKLRQVRRLLDPSLRFEHLPGSVQRELFRASVVVHVTADPLEICARKLRRSGEDVTECSLAAAYERAAEAGQWQEYGPSREDLEQAARSRGLKVIEIVYDDGYSVERELLPMLIGLGVVTDAGRSAVT